MKNKVSFIILVLSTMFCNTLLYAQNPNSTDDLNTEINRIWGLSELDRDLSSDGNPYVSSIEVSSNGEYVTIKWNGVIESEIIYYIYRATTPITTRSILNNMTVEIASINSEDSLSDSFSIQDYPLNNGPYYYAVTTSVSSMAHIFKAQPNVDITVKPIYLDTNFTTSTATSGSTSVIDSELPLVKLDTKIYINGIKSRVHSRDRVILSWDNVVNANNVEYMLYRHTNPISNKSQLGNARLISRTTDTFVNDSSLSDVGAYYYVTANVFSDDLFIAGENYTVQPISMNSDMYKETTETDFDIDKPFYYKINSIDAFIDDGDAVIQWSLPEISSKNYHYLLFTSTNKFYSGQNVIVDSFLSGAKKILVSDVKSESNGNIIYIDSTAKNLINKPIYYSLFIVSEDRIPSVVLSDGMYTVDPILFTLNTRIDGEEEDTNIQRPTVIEDDTKKTDGMYNKALGYFNQNKYKDTKNLLEPLSNSISDKKLYYDANLILAISYYKLGQKRKALDTLRKIRNTHPSEVDFWIGQVLSDL